MTTTNDLDVLGSMLYIDLNIPTKLICFWVSGALVHIYLVPSHKDRSSPCHPYQAGSRKGQMISIKHSIVHIMRSTYRGTEHPDHKGSSSHPGGKRNQGDGFGSHTAFLKRYIS